MKRDRRVILKGYYNEITFVTMNNSKIFGRIEAFINLCLKNKCSQSHYLHHYCQSLITNIYLQNSLGFINAKFAILVEMKLSKSKDLSLMIKTDGSKVTVTNSDIDKSKDVISSKGNMFHSLPPVICNNPRELIGPEKVNVSFNDKTISTASSTSRRSSKTLEMVPRHALHITWSPDCLCFDIDRDVIINRLWIWNLCPRTIYLQVCGFWNDVARRGASWICKPRTRFRLASGLKAEVFIKATPRVESPVPRAYIALQLAVSHLRDNVIGYFVVPVRVKFNNCKQVALAEEETF